MKRELVWFLCPILSALWALGGTFDKDIRRMGVPLTILFFSFLFDKTWWKWLIAAVLMGLLLRLPFTLFGDAVDASWVNWLWIWILGFLYGAPSAVVHWKAIFSAFVPMFVVGFFGTLSNISATAVQFEWKFVEALIGFAVAYPIALTMRNEDM